MSFQIGEEIVALCSNPAGDCFKGYPDLVESMLQQEILGAAEICKIVVYLVLRLPKEDWN